MVICLQFGGKFVHNFEGDLSKVWKEICPQSRGDQFKRKGNNNSKICLSMCSKGAIIALKCPGTKRPCHQYSQASIYRTVTLLTGAQSFPENTEI